VLLRNESGAPGRHRHRHRRAAADGGTAGGSRARACVVRGGIGWRRFFVSATGREKPFQGGAGRAARDRGVVVGRRRRRRGVPRWRRADWFLGLSCQRLRHVSVHGTYTGNVGVRRGIDVIGRAAGRLCFVSAAASTYPTSRQPLGAGRRRGKRRLAATAPADSKRISNR